MLLREHRERGSPGRLVSPGKLMPPIVPPEQAARRRGPLELGDDPERDAGKRRNKISAVGTLLGFLLQLAQRHPRPGFVEAPLAAPDDLVEVSMSRFHHCLESHSRRAGSRAQQNLTVSSSAGQSQSPARARAKKTPGAAL